MRSAFKYLTAGGLLMTLTIIGFVSALRGCLSAYDERYAISPVLYLKRDNLETLFSLVQYNETTSYSSEQGIVTKTFDNHYFIQINNAKTGETISSSEIKGRTKGKAVDAAVIGATEDAVWVFVDGLLAFDVSTLQQVANTKMIEDKNPLIKGKLPGESQYYKFSKANKNIGFTAKDGSLWVLNTKTLLVTPTETIIIKDPGSDDAAFQSRLKNLQRLNIDFSEMGINQDTANGQWIVLYSKEEMKALRPQISFAGAYGQDIRRQLSTKQYTTIPESGSNTDKLIFENAEPSVFYLDGGLLVNKETAKVIRLNNPGGYLIIYKSQIGASGEIMLCRTTDNGKPVWKTKTGLSRWIDWNCSDNQIFVFGCNTDMVTSANCNLLLSIDLHTGQVNKYDYQTGKNSRITN